MHAAQTFGLILTLLAIVIALYWLALKLRFPPSAALLVGGGAKDEVLLEFERDLDIEEMSVAFQRGDDETFR